MVLVDSSVWILFRYPRALHEVVPQQEILTCAPVIEEVLRGARSEREYRDYYENLHAALILESPMDLDRFREAAEIYRSGRAQGITIRSPYDCLIAACAIRNAVPVLHIDRDFTKIATFTTLQQQNLAS